MADAPLLPPSVAGTGIGIAAGATLGVASMGLAIGLTLGIAAGCLARR